MHSYQYMTSSLTLPVIVTLSVVPPDVHVITDWASTRMKNMPSNEKILKFNECDIAIMFLFKHTH